MNALWEKVRELLSVWMIAFKTVFMVLVGIYLCFEIGQLFVDGCLTPSCDAGAHATKSKFMDFSLVFLFEVIAIALISLLLPLLWIAGKLVLYSAALALGIAFALVMVAVAIGMIAIVYLMFRDFGFWGGIMAIGGVVVVIRMFGGKARDYASSTYESYARNSIMSAGLENEMKLQEKQQNEIN
ncbi:hypothetical protein [Teredinibacter purpureus]|uniref:hypothetical protein n=1 Tax=Teredinibacter purpureus TaxID=2731756 RepID=UPI0005F80A10|nr:hypothetical protein [Teredinibacter purpureus]